MSLIGQIRLSASSKFIYSSKVPQLRLVDVKAQVRPPLAFCTVVTLPDLRLATPTAPPVNRETSRFANTIGPAPLRPKVNFWPLGHLRRGRARHNHCHSRPTHLVLVFLSLLKFPACRSESTIS